MGTRADPNAAAALRFLGTRNYYKNNYPARCQGISSDALAMYGVGQGRRPQVPGTPDYPYQPGHGGSWRGDECGHDYPHDENDLLACTITFLLAPKDVQARMLPVLDEFQRWVWDGVNRYGYKASDGYRDGLRTEVSS